MSLMIVNHDGSLRPPRPAVFYPFGFGYALMLEAANNMAAAARCFHTLAELSYLLMRSATEKPR